MPRNARSRRFKLRRHHDWFTCAGCRRFRPPEEGCADDLPDHCDRCWVQAHEVCGV